MTTSLFSSIKGVLRGSMIPLLFGVALLAAYSPGLRAPFYYDDDVQILDNPVMRIGPEGLAGRTAGILKGPYFSSRPLAMLSFVANRFVSGEDPFPFRLMNLLFHVGTALLLYRYLHRLAGPDSPSPGMPETARFRERFPLIVSLLWALNATHTQTVTYIVQRMNGGMAFFAIASLLLFTAGVRWNGKPAARWVLLGLALLSGFASLGFKQNAVILPLLCIFQYLLFERKEPVRLRVPVAVGALALAAAVLGILWTDWGRATLDTAGGGSIGRHALTAARVIPYLVGLFLLPIPSRLHLNYDIPMSDGLLSPPATLVGVLFIAGWVAGIAFFWKRDRWIAFGLAWMLFAVLPESVLPALHPVFEHRLYLPSIGLAMALGRGAYIGFRRVLPSGVRAPEVLCSGVLLALALLSAFWTAQRNRDWADPARFWAHEMEMAPGNADSVQGKLLMLLKTGKSREAIDFGEESLRKGIRGQEASSIWTNLSIAYAKEGEWDRMRKMLEASGAAGGERRFEVYNLGVAYFHLGRKEAASRKFRRLLELDPGNPDGLYYLGLILQEQGDLDGAVDAFRRALQSRPTDILAVQKLGEVYEARSEWPKAAWAAGRLEELGGNSDPILWFREGYVYLRAKMADRAEASLRRYLAYFPNDPAANFNLACALSLKGRTGESLQILDRLLETGFRNRALIMDRDLDAVRREPGYPALLKKHGIGTGATSAEPTIG